MFNKMYCHGCGKIVESVGHVCEKSQQIPVGWKCPVCGTGNAPWALSCQKCIEDAAVNWPTFVKDQAI